MGFRRIVALPVLGGLVAMTGVVAVAATTLADPASEVPAVGGKLLDPEGIQIVTGPPASPVSTPPPSSTTPPTTAPSTESPSVVEPTPPAAPDTEPQASSTTSTPQPPGLLTGVLGALGLPTTPCTGPECDEQNVTCPGDNPVCVQTVP